MGKVGETNNAASQNNDGHIAREEAKGKAVWKKLQAKELTCKDLSDDNFGTLGEYFMGQMFTLLRSEAFHRGWAIRSNEQYDDSDDGRKRRGTSAYCNGQAFERLRHFCRIFVAERRLYADDEYDVGEAGRPPLNSNQLNNSMMNFGFMPLWIWLDIYDCLLGLYNLGDCRFGERRS